jgi:hypothetical protein
MLIYTQSKNKSSKKQVAFENNFLGDDIIKGNKASEYKLDLFINFYHIQKEVKRMLNG